MMFVALFEPMKSFQNAFRPWHQSEEATLGYLLDNSYYPKLPQWKYPSENISPFIWTLKIKWPSKFAIYI